MYDIIVIGGGVIGGCILRELTMYRVHACLLEKGSDVCMGQSRANSGIVHAGFDAPEGSLKAKFNVDGCAMMPAYAEELGVKYQQVGSLVVAFSEEQKTTLQSLLARGRNNGVQALEIVEGDALFALEPNLSRQAVAALYAPDAGIICPYTLTIAAIGNAMDNGAELYTEFDVVRIQKGQNGFTVTAADGREVQAKLVINAAGLGGEAVARAAGDSTVKLGGRRGEYILLNKESGVVTHTLFFTPTALGKGILVSPTVDGNLLLGPTAEESDGSTDTSAQMLSIIQSKAKEMCPSVPLQNVITSFAGVRAYCSRHDFIVEESGCVEGLINCVGIESPGLTSAPAIAKYVAEQLVAKHLPLEKNGAFCGRREADHAFREMSAEEKNAVIRTQPAYGKIVCRCESVTEGEIVHAIHANPPARSVDAVKRRTRAGMGGCQSGFCQPSVAAIIARECNVPLEKVRKDDAGSELLTGRSK